MGFSHFYQLFDYFGLGQGIVTPVTLDNLLDGGNRKRWILIDVSNVRFQSGFSVGVHSALQKLYEETFWKEFLKSRPNVSVMLFLDSKYVISLRASIKMGRVNSELEDALNFDQSADISDFLDWDYHTTYNYADIMAKLFIPDEHSNLPFQIIKCPGEADIEIRKVATEKLSQNDIVYILSDDSSLMLGLSGSINMISPLRLQVCRHSLSLSVSSAVGENLLSEEESSLFLRVRAYPIYQGSHSFTALLKALILDKIHFHNIQSQTDLARIDFDADCLLLISALLGGEYGTNDVTDESNPYHLVQFLVSYFFPETSSHLPGSEYRINYNDKSRNPIKSNAMKIGQLLAISTVVLLWKLYEVPPLPSQKTQSYSPQQYSTQVSSSSIDKIAKFESFLNTLNKIQEYLRTQNSNSRNRNASARPSYCLYTVLRADNSSLDCYTKVLNMNMKKCLSVLLDRIRSSLDIPMNFHHLNVTSVSTSMNSIKATRIIHKDDKQIHSTTATTNTVNTSISTATHTTSHIPITSNNTVLNAHTTSPVTGTPTTHHHTTSTTATAPLYRMKRADWSNLYEPIHYDTNQLLHPLRSLVAQYEYIINLFDTTTKMTNIDDDEDDKLVAALTTTASTINNTKKSEGDSSNGEEEDRYAYFLSKIMESSMHIQPTSTTTNMTCIQFNDSMQSFMTLPTITKTANTSIVESVFTHVHGTQMNEDNTEESINRQYIYITRPASTTTTATAATTQSISTTKNAKTGQMSFSQLTLFQHVLSQQTIPLSGVYIHDHKTKHSIQFSVVPYEQMKLYLRQCHTNYHYWNEKNKNNISVNHTYSDVLFHMNTRYQILKDLYLEYLLTWSQSQSQSQPYSTHQTTLKSPVSTSIKTNNTSLTPIQSIPVKPYKLLYTLFNITPYSTLDRCVLKVVSLWKSSPILHHLFAATTARTTTARTTTTLTTTATTTVRTTNTDKKKEQEEEDIEDIIHMNATLTILSLLTLFQLGRNQEEELSLSLSDLIYGCLLSPLFGYHAKMTFVRNLPVNSPPPPTTTTTTTTIVPLSTQNVDNTITQSTVKTTSQRDMIVDCSTLSQYNILNDFERKSESLYLLNTYVHLPIENVLKEIQSNIGNTKRNIGSIYQLRYVEILLKVYNYLMTFTPEKYRPSYMTWLDGYGITTILRIRSIVKRKISDGILPNNNTNNNDNNNKNSVWYPLLQLLSIQNEVDWIYEVDDTHAYILQSLTI